MTSINEIVRLIKESRNLVFLTGAGVSTPSGIPDYRGMDGLYTKEGLKEPEYLLSRRALLHDTVDFHQFIKQLYRPDVTPNVIHKKMAQLQGSKNVTIITQNIDGLHSQAGSRDVVEFHGTLATCYCTKCHSSITTCDFINSYSHENCGGLIRPDVILYDEQINPKAIRQSVDALSLADAVVIVGTSFQVYPFASLIQYAHPDAKILTINKTPVDVTGASARYVGDAVDVFELLL